MVRTKTKKAAQSGMVSDDQRRKAIEEAAYFRWLNRGGGSGLETEDWLSAEQEIMRNVFDHPSEN